MRYVSRALLAGGLGLVAAFLAACGASSGLLSSSEASSLTTQLNAASADVTNGDCGSAEKAIDAVETQIANLPGSVNPTLVTDLSRGAATVRALAKTDCGGTVGTSTDNTTSTSTATATNPRTTSTSTSTDTTSTLTTTTPATTTGTQTAPATTTSTPGTTSTGGGGGGAPTGGTGNTGGGNSQGNTGN